MITDMFGKEFKYLDYVIYLRDDKPVLARIARIVIAQSSRLVCNTVIGYYNSVEKVTLKRFNTIEIISEDKAKELFPDEYVKLCKYVW